MNRRKKRFWADEEKRGICARATTPGISVAQVARRYAVNAKLVFDWLKDPRFAPEVAGSEQDATFLPSEVETDVTVEPDPIDVPVPSLSAPLSDGRRILIEGPTAQPAVVRLVQGLTV